MGSSQRGKVRNTVGIPICVIHSNTLSCCTLCKNTSIPNIRFRYKDHIILETLPSPSQQQEGEGCQSKPLKTVICDTLMETWFCILLRVGQWTFALFRAIFFAFPVFPSPCIVFSFSCTVSHIIFSPLTCLHPVSCTSEKFSCCDCHLITLFAGPAVHTRFFLHLLLTVSVSFSFISLHVPFHSPH